MLTGARAPSDRQLWPATLPPGAKWLPYSVQAPAAVTAPPAERVPPAPPAPQRAPFVLLPREYWRLLLAAGLIAGLVGIIGGAGLGIIFGAR